LTSTVPHGRIASLDGWRGIAILLVLLGHFYPVSWINLGIFGVEFFFVLSGRLMAQILFLNKFPLPEFFFRRATRILPALICFVGIYIGVAAIIGEPFALSPVWGASAVTFTLNYLMVFTGHRTGFFDHIWSLCVEEHAYFLLGLIVLFFGRPARRAVLVVGGLALLMMANGLISSLILHQNPEMVYYRSDVHVASVFISAAVFLFLRSQMDAAWLKRIALPLFLVSLTAGIWLSSEASSLEIMFTAGTFCLAVAVALVDIAAKPVAAAFANPVLTRFGLWSYSIYLWQQPFYKADEFYPGYTIWFLAVSLVCGVASYYLVERPMRRGLNALWPVLQTRFARKRAGAA